MEGGSGARPGQSGAKSQITASGGMRQTFGGGLNEAHLDEAALSSSGQQQAQNQQASVLGQQGAAKQLAAQQGAGKSPLAQTPEKQQTPPRAVSDLGTELFKRPAVDTLDGVKSIFSVNRLLNINPGDGPEEQAKKAKIAQNWQKLTAAEQQVAQQAYQEKLQKKRQEEEEAAEKKRQEEEQKQAELPVPQGRKTGFQGFAGMGGKKKARAMVQQQRTTMGGAE